MSDILWSLPFGHNQPLKLADDKYIGILRNKINWGTHRWTHKTRRLYLVTVSEWVSEWGNHRTCSFICTHIKTFPNSTILLFYICDMIFTKYFPKSKINYIYRATGLACCPNEKFWVHIWAWIKFCSHYLHFSSSSDKILFERYPWRSVVWQRALWQVVCWILCTGVSVNICPQFGMTSV
jgi:hypothetical protein